MPCSATCPHGQLYSLRLPDPPCTRRTPPAGIPPAPRGTPQIEVSFEIDANGGSLPPLLCWLLCPCQGWRSALGSAAGAPLPATTRCAGAPPDARLPSRVPCAAPRSPGPAGILNVAAVDKGSGKSEKITITNDKGGWRGGTGKGEGKAQAWCLAGAGAAGGVERSGRLDALPLRRCCRPAARHRPRARTAACPDPPPTHAPQPLFPPARPLPQAGCRRRRLTAW